MSKIPVIKCPECGVSMKYRGGPSESNLFIMVCPVAGCHYQETCYMETSSVKKEGITGD